MRVRFGSRRVGGWVVSLGAPPPDGVELRELAAVSGIGPPPAVLSLAAWAAWRWAMPLATVLRAASPERNVWSLPAPPAPHGGAPVTQPGDDGPAPAGAAPGGVTLRREGPAQDLLPLVLDVVASADGQVLVLVPASGWAARLTERLRRRGVDVASGWEEAAAGWPVVVGSRGAAWAPAERLGAAVVLDAHDYHDRYDAALVVAERAQRDGARCLLVSPCPTAVQRATFGPVELPARSAERSAWAPVVVVDRRGADPRTGLFSEELVALVRRVLPERVVCVLNRTGRARLLACAACGSLARCAACGRPVSGDGQTLRCPACGTERPSVCDRCGASRLKVLRRGVSRVREELAALLGTDVGEVTGDSATVPGVPVLVGTEAVLHRVRHAGAVCFLDFDDHLLAPRFSAGEESLSLLARASRLVGGRGTGGGTVLVQTRVADHEVLRAATAGDPGLFTETELREELRLPPFSALATVRSPAQPVLAGVEAAALGGGRWLLRAPDHVVLCDALGALHGGVRVDPLDV